jgi:hypothetical protein
MEGEMGGTCSMHGRHEKSHKIFVEKLDGKGPLRRPRLKWKYNIGICHTGIGREGVE